jgi:8-oxo-dGTP diphosphatase
MNTQFHYLSRGIIWSDGKVLLAHQIGADNTFLPGGHIENNEPAQAALSREILEELGAQATIRSFVGAVEAGWSEESFTHHEINLVFEAAVSSFHWTKPVRSLESHLEFFWSDLKALSTHNLLPKSMIQCLEGWSGGYRTFWGSEMA